MVADVICGQIGTNDLTADKIEAEVKLAPSPARGSGFVFAFQPLALAEDLQSRAVDHQMDQT